MTSAIDFLPTISSCQAVSQINRATARWGPHAGNGKTAWGKSYQRIVESQVKPHRCESSPDQATGPIWLFLLSHNLRSTTILTLRCCHELSTHQLAASFYERRPWRICLARSRGARELGTA